MIFILICVVIVFKVTLFIKGGTPYKQEEKIMDYSINNYLNRLSIEELEILLKYCKEHKNEYKYIIKGVYQAINKKKNEAINL